MIGLIKSLFAGDVAQITFFSLFLGGLIFTIIGLIFGHDGDVDHEVDLDHDMDMDNDVDHDGDHPASSGPSVFSVRSMCIMLTGFGGVGFLVQRATNHILFASVAGAASGFIMSLVFIAIIRMFYRQQGSSLLTRADYMQASGTVTTAIPQDGLGEVALSVAGTTQSRPARSFNGKPIPSGRPIFVVQYLGGTVSVKEESEVA